MKRTIDSNLLDQFLKTDLWIEQLKKDCFQKEILFTIRENEIRLYHKGRLLFSYSNRGFKTNLKFASVIEKKDDNYIHESELKNYKLHTEFLPNYDRIKENCLNYSEKEASNVASFSERYSYLSDSNIVVLDIEPSLKSLNEDNNQDRIDLVLLNKETSTIKFVEAKHYSNKQITPKGAKLTEVLNQIKRYQEQVHNTSEEILEIYATYIEEI